MTCLIVPMYIFRVLIYYNVDLAERLFGPFSPIFFSFFFFFFLFYSFFWVVIGGTFQHERLVVKVLDTNLVISRSIIESSGGDLPSILRRDADQSISLDELK